MLAFLPVCDFESLGLDDGAWIIAQNRIATTLARAFGTLKEEGFTMTTDFDVGGEWRLKICGELGINRHDVAFFCEAAEFIR